MIEPPATIPMPGSLDREYPVSHSLRYRKIEVHHFYDPDSPGIIRVEVPQVEKDEGHIHIEGCTIRACEHMKR